MEPVGTQVEEIVGLSHYYSLVIHWTDEPRTLTIHDVLSPEGGSAIARRMMESKARYGMMYGPNFVIPLENVRWIEILHQPGGRIRDEVIIHPDHAPVLPVVPEST